MDALHVLTNIAVILIAAALWDDMRRGGRVTLARRTWLLVACIFAAVSAVLHIAL
jgi:hypothetical protein